jgi:uncharacterized membrane protein YebE (DUF533 family)
LADKDNNKSRYSRFDDTDDDYDVDGGGKDDNDISLVSKGGGGGKKSNLFGIPMSQDIVNSIMAIVGIVGAGLGGYAIYDNFKSKNEQEALKKQQELERRRQYLLYLQQREQQAKELEQKQQDLIEKKNNDNRSLNHNYPVIKSHQYTDPIIQVPYLSSSRVGGGGGDFGGTGYQEQYYQPAPLHHSPTGETPREYSQSVPLTDQQQQQHHNLGSVNMNSHPKMSEYDVPIMPYESGTARFPSVDPSRQPMHPSQVPISNINEDQQQEDENGNDNGQQKYEEAEATQEYPSNHPTQEEIDELYRNINGTTQ